MEPKRILYVNGGIMSRGGIESYMMNYYRNLDRTKIQIDFIVHGFEKGVYDDEIISLGGKLYNIPVKSKDYIGNIKALRKIFLSGKYNIVHSHMDAMSMIVLKEAKRCGIPIRIAHSHNTQHLTNNNIKFLLNEYARKNIRKYANYLFACSEEAGRWLFGNESVNSGEVKIINNAIEIDKFKFDKNKRNEIRKELNIENNFVIGHVGRFDYQKNHMFLLKIFKETLNYINNAKLILVGDGHLKEEILNRIEELNIQTNVIVLGARNDVNDLNNAFDIFILPSLFEGFPVVAVEAQANGLQCLFSDSITKEVKLSKCTYFMSNEEAIDKWANKINYIKNTTKRLENANKIVEEKYCIKVKAKELEELYLELLKS